MTEEELTYEGENDCVCAHCGNTRLQFSRVDVYVKGYLENDPGIHVVVGPRTKTATVFAGDALNSPFSEGDGAAITLWCGKCRKLTGVLIGTARGYATQRATQRVERPRYRPRTLLPIEDSTTSIGEYDE